MSLLHIGGTEYEEGHTGIRKIPAANRQYKDTVFACCFQRKRISYLCTMQ